MLGPDGQLPPMDLNNIPRRSTHSRRPIATPQDDNGQVDPSLIQETHNVAMQLGDKFVNTLDQEDDKGQFQQVSGGFGDSTNLDEEAVKILLAHQLKATMLQKKYKVFEPEEWEQIAETMDYQMESQVFDFEILKQSPEFGMKNYNEAVYRGELTNGKREGLGVMQYRKARVYEGEWKHDQRNGRGMERYSNGNRYEGDFSNGKPHGNGVYSWANGEVYEGEWDKGLK